MKAKVSMVIPCYNKELYLSGMLQSVLKQDWDTIELILVNDGSTDGTRAMIAEWEPRLRARGFDVLVIDQENKGVGAAVLAGMRRATGDYFCTVDADDTLHTDYVSTMAGFLEEHPAYEWTCCQMEGNLDSAAYRKYYSVSPERPMRLYRLMLRRVTLCSCQYMVRMRYLRQCHVAESFSTEPRFSQEPQYLTPLYAGNGAIKELPQILYRYNQQSGGTTVRQHFADMFRCMDEYFELTRKTIDTLDVPKKTKQVLTGLAKCSFYEMVYNFCHTFPDWDTHVVRIAAEWAELINRLFIPSPGVLVEDILRYGWRVFAAACQVCALGESQKYLHLLADARRVVGCGALGRIGKKYIPMLAAAGRAPDILWDASAKEGSAVAGIPVSQPDFSELNKDDTVLAFPFDDVVAAELRQKAERQGVTQILCGREIIAAAGLLVFPQFADCALPFTEYSLQEQPQDTNIN